MRGFVEYLESLDPDDVPPESEQAAAFAEHIIDRAERMNELRDEFTLDEEMT